MELFKLFIFLPACFALNMAPGPNNLLSMNNARSYGFRAAIIAGLGRLLAFSVMIMLAASGLALILYTSEKLFFIIKLIGSAYLFWIAIQLWRSDVSPMNTSSSNKDLFGLVRQEFTLAAGNPKAILIFTAFLPQFVEPNSNMDLQFFILGTAFLALEMVAISIYAAIGLYLRHWFSSPRMARAFNRCCALFLGAAGGSLLVKQQ